MCDSTMGSHWQCVDGHNWNYVVAPTPPPAACRMAPPSNHIGLSRAPHPDGQTYGITVGIAGRDRYIWQCECGRIEYLPTLAEARDAALAHHRAGWSRHYADKYAATAERYRKAQR